MKKRTWIIVLATACLLLQGWWFLHSQARGDGGAWAQTQSPGTVIPVPQPGTQGPTPGVPGAGQSGVQPVRQFPMTLPELLWGITQLQSTDKKLSQQQIDTILPALQKVVQASQQISLIETKMKTVLTEKQIRYIKEKQAKGELELSLPNPSKPGEDPLIAEVLKRLEAKAK